MFNIAELKGNAPLTNAQFKFIQAEVVVAARQPSVSRKLANIIGPLGLGVQRYDYYNETEVNDAILTWAFQNGGEDIVNLTNNNTKIPILEKKWRIPRRMLESSRRMGTPLDVTTAQSAAYKVSLLENDLVIQGYASDDSNYDINGFYQGAGNSTAGSSFGSAGGALASVEAAMALMMVDNIFPPYNLVLNPTQYAELAGSVHTGGMNEFSRVSSLLAGQPQREDGSGSNIFVSPDIVAGQGLQMATPNQNHFKIAVAQDVTAETWLDPDTKDLKGRVFEAILPIIYDSNALCKLTTI